VLIQTTANRGLTANECAERVYANKARAAASIKGRQRLAKVVENRNPGFRSLSALRLLAGLSQTELAQRMSKQQPKMARLEKTLGDPSLSTLQKLAKALCVGIAQVIAAVEATKKRCAHDV
jgi:ribosome-binding protein aMBF1 (putative translation factor)